MKITMIGPVFPYKGGIAHYTSLMTKALMKSHDVTLISFKFQYPSFLYPGKEQKDYDNDSFKVDNVEYILHTVNFLSWRSSYKYIKRSDPDLVFFQWWNPFFAPLFTYLAKRVKKRLKKKTMVLSHNTLPHEKIPFDKALARRFFKYIDRFIVQSKEDEKKLIELKPEVILRRTVHPTYNIFKFNNKSIDQAREELSIGKNDNVLLFFGFIREYKGLKTLLNALPKVLSTITSNTKLLVVGDFYSEKDSYLEIIKNLKLEDNIIIRDGYIPDKDVGVYFQACDVVVLPYYSATQSGIVQIAYGFEKPVISTDVGGLPEVVENGITGLTVPPKDSNSLSSAIADFFNNNLGEEFTENIKKQQEKYSWDRMVTIIEELYKN